MPLISSRMMAAARSRYRVRPCGYSRRAAAAWLNRHRHQRGPRAGCAGTWLTYEGYWKSCVPRYSREPTSPPAIRTIPTFILAFGLTRATMTARRVEGHDDAANRATGESAGILGAAGVSTGPSMGPAIFCCSPAIPNGSSTTSGIATANGHATVCAIAYVGPGTSGLPVSTVTAGPGLCFSLPLPESGNGPAEPTISRARAIRAFVGTADRITGY